MKNIELSVLGHNTMITELTDVLPNLLQNVRDFKGLAFKVNDKPTVKFAESCKVESKKWSKNGTFYSRSSFFDVCGGSLWFNTTICINGGSYDDRSYFCRYFKEEKYIGTVENGKITSVIDTERSILRLSKKTTVKKEALKIAKYKAMTETLRLLQFDIVRYVRDSEDIK